MTHDQEHPAVAAARALAVELLAPAAEQVDREGVPLSHLRAIAEAGLLGLHAPRADGGSAAPPSVVRRVTELLAGADCSTWFVTAQHHSPVRALAASHAPVRERLLGPLARGELLSGVAFSHLRRWPQRPVRTARVARGWRFDGVAPWCTGWGLTDVLLLFGVTDVGEVVAGFVEARESAHLRPSAPLALAALSAAQTVRLTLEGLTVGEDDVVTHLPWQRWAAEDRRTTAAANPAVLGLTEAALRLLREQGQQPGGLAAAACAERMGQRLAGLRTRCYRLADELADLPADSSTSSQPDVEFDGGQLLEARADAHHLLVAATSALVAAGGGASMELGHPAQRLAREALFLLVQAQSAPVRTATLARWSR